MKKIYLDNAATTQLDKRVLKAIQPYFFEKYGNASSLHKFGREAKDALEKSREEIAKMIGANANEIIFTSGGTESDNLAIIGAALANRSKGKHIIATKIEHHAVLEPCKWLSRNGFDITYLNVDRNGLVNLDDLKSAMRKDTILVSVMHANNEIGTIEPIAEIGKFCREHGILFHTDAVQTFGKVLIDVKKMNIDLLSASAHKIYGPKGVGALFIRDGVKIESISQGGGHERGLRSGTENVAGIIGFAEASRLCRKEMKKEAKRETQLRDYLIKKVLKIDGSWLNGDPKKRLTGNAHFGFKFIEGEALIMLLDEKGIAASTGSACSSKSLEPSHVLMALGLKHEEAHGSLRITLGRFTTKKDVDYLVKVLPGCVEKLRKISPFKR